MLYVGLGFLVTWLEVQVFSMDIVKAFLVSAIIFIVIGLLTDGAPSFKAPWIRRA